MLSTIFLVYKKVKDILYDVVLKKQCVVGANTKFFASASILNAQKNKNLIKIGNNSMIRGEFFIYGHGGSIEIGDYCYIGENSKIWSSSSISIGNRVLIAHNVNIHDSNSHPLDAKSRFEHSKAIVTTGHPKKGLDLLESAVVIKDDAWIGFNASVLKGVTIGEGAIVAACSVVTKDVPPFTVVAGNPAKVVRTLQKDEPL